MVADAWLPVGFSLPDGQCVASIINAGQDWQIVNTDRKQLTLIVRSFLADRWIQSKLLDEGNAHRFDFGASGFVALTSNESHELASLANCRSPASKGEAM